MEDPMKKHAIHRRDAIIGLTVAAAAVSVPGSLRAAEASGEKAEKAGVVSRLRGAAVAVLDAVPRVLGVGAAIYIGDVLSTGPDARLEIKMHDDGLFQLGERTSFTVIDYTFGGTGGAAARLLSGALNGVTGKLASAKGLKIETEVATIGIRGTKFWAGDIDDLMHIAHWSGGGLVIENRGGRVEMTGKGFGTEVASATTPPTEPKPWPHDMTSRAHSMTDF